MKILKRYDDGRTKAATSIKEKKKKVTFVNEGGKDKLLNPLLVTFGMLFNNGKKIACL